jgi:3-oxoacyl-[acyl-carrier protein] reductase
MGRVNANAVTMLRGRVAVVTGADRERGRGAALLLAAQGVKVVVVGENERAVAEVVGEIAFGGGAARHVAGAGPAALEAAIARARAVFGGLHYVVHA